MSHADDKKDIVLDQTVISDEEAQFSGDVETPWLEVVEQAAAPTLPTDKVSALLYALTADHKLRVKLSDGTVLDLTAAGSAPLTFVGTIAAATDFPLLADVAAGHVYRVTADVTDDDATKTHTHQSFLAGQDIAWNGATWSSLGPDVAVTLVNTTPFTVGAGDVAVFVDTATIGAASAGSLPAVAATKLGKIVVVGDYTGDAAAHNITLTPNGTDKIDGVNAALVLSQNNLVVALECVGTEGWKTIYAARSATGFIADKTKLDGIEALADVTDATNVAAAGAIMDADVTTNGRMVRTGAGTYTTVLDSLANTAAPTVNNDASGGAGGKEKGFSVGSIWADATAKKAYVCLDATNAAAVWREIDAGGALTTAGDLLMASAAGVIDRLAAGAVGTVLAGNGAGVAPSYQAVAGLAVDVLDAVIAVADAPSGATTAALTLQINDLAGAPIAHAGIVKILAKTTQYGGEQTIQTNVTFGTATVGSILATGNGWAVVKTSAVGAFACTATDASDDTVWFSVCTADGGHDALAAGVLVRGCLPDAATWSA